MQDVKSQRLVSNKYYQFTCLVTQAQRPKVDSLDSHRYWGAYVEGYESMARTEFRYLKIPGCPGRGSNA